MIAVAALLVAASVAFVCPVHRAEYRLRGEPEVAAWFRPVKSGPEWPAHLALAIEFRRAAQSSYPRSGRTYWWLPWDGGTNGQQNLASTTDVTLPGWRAPDPDAGPRPFGDMRVIFADRAYNLWSHVPRMGEPAPAHILVPDLRDLRHVAGGVMDATDKQFFDLVNCRSTREV